jgi:hypothetical protein
MDDSFHFSRKIQVGRPIGERFYSIQRLYLMKAG